MSDSIVGFLTSVLSGFPSGTRGSRLAEGPHEIQGTAPDCSSEGPLATLGSV